MPSDRPPLFGKARLLEGLIDEFLDKVSEGVIHFERSLLVMVDGGDLKVCEEKLTQLGALKQRCNEIRRLVVSMLYQEMLIPDFRADVLTLLSHLFTLLDRIEKTFHEFMIEHSGTSGRVSGVKDDVRELVEVTARSAQAAVVAARAFFRNPAAVRDHVNEIRVFEAEADRITLRLKTVIFDSDLPLDAKMHARDSVDVIDALADLAEDISDELSIAAIKRAL